MTHFSFMQCHVNIFFDVSPKGKEYVLFCALEQVTGRKTLDLLAQKIWIRKLKFNCWEELPIYLHGFKFSIHKTTLFAMEQGVKH